MSKDIGKSIGERSLTGSSKMAGEINSWSLGGPVASFACSSDKAPASAPTAAVYGRLSWPTSISEREKSSAKKLAISAPFTIDNVVLTANVCLASIYWKPEETYFCLHGFSWSPRQRVPPRAPMRDPRIGTKPREVSNNHGRYRAGRGQGEGGRPDLYRFSLRY